MKKHCILSVIFTIYCTLLSAQYTYKDETKFIQEKGQNPSDYIISKFKNHDIVLLGEDHGIKDHLHFVEELIPQLYNAGIYNLCMEFGAFEMQGKLDSLLTAPSYNEQLARDMMFYYNVGWAYKEYTDLYKAVWKVNQTIPAGKKKFRIVNISYQYDWDKFSIPRTPENMSKVFHLGTPDKFRTEIIEKEIIDKKEKAIVYMGLVHTFTKYGMPILKTNNDDFCDYDMGFTGNRLYKKYTDKVFNIMLHMPLESRQKHKPYLLSPANGAIEVIMNENKNKPVGFDLKNSIMGNLPDNSFFSMCHDNFKMGDFFDGYIFIKPFKSMEGCTIDSHYFEGKAWSDIKSQMPDPDWHTSNSLDEYMKKINSYVNVKDRYREVIEQSIPSVQNGSIDRYTDFPSQYIQPRNVDVWLPENYSPNKKYSVIYMHDGQMLFDKNMTWNGQAWGADSTVNKLMQSKKIRECIIVGIWNTKLRYYEYFPQKPFEMLSSDLQQSLMNGNLHGKILSDNYLLFLTEELKPFIDKNYNTHSDADNTVIMGSSMGGLISLYAICEYPHIFGAAACLSTHWIGGSVDAPKDIAQAFLKYMETNLPSSSKNKIYFDYGTEGLDGYYKSSQLMADKIMLSKKYTSKNWITKEFEGKDHSEASWRERLDIPLLFLLAK